MELRLNENVECTLKSNIEILFMHLKNSIEEYIGKGECIGLTTKKAQQKNAYEKIFQHKEILNSLNTIVEKLLSENEDKRL